MRDKAIIKCTEQEITAEAATPDGQAVKTTRRWIKAAAREVIMTLTSLLEPDLEETERRRRRKQITEKTTYSERTIRFYVEAYRQKGFDGLCPKTRIDAGKAREIKKNILDEAEQLKKELPKRSIRQVIAILEGEGKVKPRILRPSTVARQLSGLRLKKILKTKTQGFKRFRKEHRNMLWQADLKYGRIYRIPITRRKNAAPT
mgnify:CR=1 FL=1